MIFRRRISAVESLAFYRVHPIVFFIKYRPKSKNTRWNPIINDRTLEDVEPSESLKKSIENNSGVRRRIDPTNESLLQAIIHRIKKQEETAEEKKKYYRRRGVGIAANQIIGDALELLLNERFSEERPVEEYTEKEVAAHRFKDNEGGLENEFIREHAEAMREKAERELGGEE